MAEAKQRLRSPFQVDVDDPACSEVDRRERRLGLGIGLFWSCLWLIWLVPVFLDAVRLDHPIARVLGAGTVIAFIACYVAHFIARSAVFADNPAVEPSPLARADIVRYLILWLLACALILQLGEPGLTAVIFAAISALWTLRWPAALAVCVGTAAALTIAMLTVSGWELDFGGLVALGFATLAVLAAQAAARRQRALGLARTENAQLAVQAERNRMARDLHDILGHSLTVITIKAELAGRLLEVDPERAKAEINDLERLSRSALADVRGAVEGFREISLAGELSRAKAALHAAGIEPVMPSSVEDVPEDLREVFAWTVREAVTNVLRHSHATRCEIALGAERVTVRDNGIGHHGIAGGEGLVGLRERARIAGLQLQVGMVAPSGVQVTMTTTGATT